MILDHHRYGVRNIEFFYKTSSWVLFMELLACAYPKSILNPGCSISSPWVYVVSNHLWTMLDTVILRTVNSKSMQTFFCFCFWFNQFKLQWESQGTFPRISFLGRSKLPLSKKIRLAILDLTTYLFILALGSRLTAEKNETLKVHFASWENVEEQKIIWEGSAKFLLS